VSAFWSKADGRFEWKADAGRSAPRCYLQSMAVVLAGMLYFVIVFTFAFAMGVARTFIVAPRVGTTAAVLIEVPVLLLASWGVARRLLRQRPFSFPQRASIGATAFALTMVSEAVLAGLLRGQNAMQWALDVATPLGLVGLAGQLGFAAMPIFVGRRSHGAGD
jgi:hypothetical protein